MIRIIIITLLISFATSCFGQIENRWQPDSVYLNRKVKKIYVYLNSPKDLSEIVEFDEKGKRIRVEKYNASYNRRTRKSKRIKKISLYKYDSFDRLTKIVDSVGNDSITFQYGTNGKVISSRKNLGNFLYETKYFYNPYKTITTRRKDSLIIYHKTKEYDKDYYINHFFGHYSKAKLKKIKSVVNGDTNIVAYSDHSDLIRYEDNKVINNRFDEFGRLESSDIRSVFMNDRVNEYQLTYNYYKNGLLKSIRGYIPRYFTYEFYE